MTYETTILVSALAGLGSFLSPCILPIIPGFLSYLSSSSIKEANEEGALDEKTDYKKGSTIIITKKAKINIFINTVYFVLGFSLIFSVLGVILNGILATSIGNNFHLE
jgi:cytochrome c-type biogenesis protein